MKLRWVMCGVIVAMMMWSRPLPAQCGGGGSSRSSHDHSGNAKVDDTLQRATIIEAMLAEKQSRQALMEAVLKDPLFIGEMTARLLEQPEWRALVAGGLGLDPATPPASAAPAQANPQPSAPPNSLNPTKAPVAPNVQKTLYRCPMHPEVTSDQPGRCPKCGMALSRVN